MPFVLLFPCLSLGLQAQVSLDLAPVEAWLARAREAPGRPASWEAASAATLGGQKAEAAWGTFGNLPQEVPPPPAPSRIASFVTGLKDQGFRPLEAEVARLFPGLSPPEAQVHVVANGFPAWGDMYVRGYRMEEGCPVLAEEGSPCILVNACIAVDTYGKTVEAQVSTARDILRHEIFHLYFERRRRLLHLPEPPSPSAELLLTVQNEGIAHFLGAWARDRFPMDRCASALRDLETEIAALRAGTADKDLLTRATVGSSKFGSLAGMLFAYGIHRQEGEEGLRQSLARGPADFVMRYQRIAEGGSGLPKAGPETLAWAMALGEFR